MRWDSTLLLDVYKRQDILIVCSKLLTGFDAPICQVLYIDKALKEHGLLQAIARTNRLCEGKDYGMIVDYRGLIEKLDTAMDLSLIHIYPAFHGGTLSGNSTEHNHAYQAHL